MFFWEQIGDLRMAGFKRRILADDPLVAHRPNLGTLADRQADVACGCQRCGHVAMVDARQLVRQLGPDLAVAEAGARMRCGSCGSKDVATRSDRGFPAPGDGPWPENRLAAR